MQNNQDVVARRYAWFLVAVALVFSSRYATRPVLSGPQERPATWIFEVDSN